MLIRRWSGLVLSALLSVTACASPTFIDPFRNPSQSAPLASQESAMTTPSAVSPTGQLYPHTAHELLGKLLQLIDGTHSYQDLTLSRVNGVLGIDLKPLETEPDGWLYVTPLTPNWGVNIIFDDRADPAHKGMLLQFTYDYNFSQPMAAEICQMDIKAFDEVITSMGFRLSNPDYHGGIWGDYHRPNDAIYVSVSFMGDLGGPPCIGSLSIGFSPAKGDAR